MLMCQMRSPTAAVLALSAASCRLRTSVFLAPASAAAREGRSRSSVIGSLLASSYCMNMSPFLVVMGSTERRSRRGPALGGTVYRASTFLRFKSLPYALTLSKTALPTALTQELPRCTLKVPAQAHWPRWQRSRCSSGMLLTAVDDGVVDLGRFSCVSYLAAWQQPIKPGVQQLSAALWRGRS